MIGPNDARRTAVEVTFDGADITSSIRPYLLSLTNRMIRRRVPKGTDFTGITEADTLEVQRWVNEYPRGILGGRCAGRVLLELAQEAGIEGMELLL